MMLGAVGVGNQIVMPTSLVFEVINLGTSVLCSQHLGAKQQQKVVQATTESNTSNRCVNTGQ